MQRNDKAIARRGVALAVLGGIAWLLAGCASLPERRLTPPHRHALIRDQLVISCDFDLPEHHRLVEELAAQRGDLASALAIPTSDEPIHVYLFDSPQRFNAFVRQELPSAPLRRAFFVETDTQLSVYAQWGDRVAEDLRHEVAHGYLHAVVPRIPLWIDEGLAEYFEVPRGNAGLNLPHLEQLTQLLQAGTWQPDLRRLERLNNVSEMGQLDYAEAWAWTHFLLASPPRAALLQHYLQTLRREGRAPHLSDQLGRQSSSPEAELLAHLRELTNAVARATAQATAEATAAPSP